MEEGFIEVFGVKKYGVLVTIELGVWSGLLEKAAYRFFTKVVATPSPPLKVSTSPPLFIKMISFLSIFLTSKAFLTDKNCFKFFLNSKRELSLD